MRRFLRYKRPMNGTSDSSDASDEAPNPGGRPARLIESVVTHLAVLTVVAASVAAAATRPPEAAGPIAAATTAHTGTAARAEPACRSCPTVDRWSLRPAAHQG
jgi:hypothetical protein